MKKGGNSNTVWRIHSFIGVQYRARTTEVVRLHHTYMKVASYSGPLKHIRQQWLPFVLLSSESVCVCVWGGVGECEIWACDKFVEEGGRGFRWNKTADYWSANKQELPYESTVLPLCLAALVSHLRRASIPLKFVSPVPEVWYTTVISLFPVQDDEADRQTLWYPHFRKKEDDKDPQ